MSVETQFDAATVSPAAASSTQNYALFSKGASVEKGHELETCQKAARMPLESFIFDNAPLRVVTIDGEPWFVAADVCRVLGIGNPSMAVSTIDADDLSTTEVIDSMGRPQTARTVNESGLYELIFQSRKPGAKAFRRWVTHEVLPAIRRTGSYNVAPALPQTLPEALRALADVVEEREAATARAAVLALEVAENAPKVEFAESVMASVDDHSWGEAAKMLGWGRNTMLRELRARGVLTAQNVPYQKHMDPRKFRVVMSSRQGSHGEIHTDATTYVRPEGIEFIRRKLIGEAANG